MGPDPLSINSLRSLDAIQCGNRAFGPPNPLRLSAATSGTGPRPSSKRPAVYFQMRMVSDWEGNLPMIFMYQLPLLFFYCSKDHYCGWYCWMNCILISCYNGR